MCVMQRYKYCFAFIATADVVVVAADYWRRINERQNRPNSPLSAIRSVTYERILMLATDAKQNNGALCI